MTMAALLHGRVGKSYGHRLGRLWHGHLPFQLLASHCLLFQKGAGLRDALGQ